jgi:CBS domain-containing protein
MMNEEVRTIMDSNPRTTSPSQNVGVLSIEMLTEGIHQLPVVENGELVGLVTVHDLWKRYENKSTIAEMTVAEVMNTNILRISPKDKIGTAAELFADKRFKSIPVVNRDNKLRGVITAFDIIKVAFKNEYTAPILYQEAFA